MLDNANNALATGISSGTDLSTIPAIAAVNAIKLRANLTTSNPSNSPVLEDWEVESLTY